MKIKMLWKKIRKWIGLNPEDKEIPTGISRRIMQRYLIALAITAISLICTIYYFDWHYLVGLVLSAYFIYLAKSLKKDWDAGQIEEVVLICSSMGKSLGIGTGAKKTWNINFRTAAETPQYFTFYWSNAGKECPFRVGGTYVIYYDPSHPYDIQGFHEL